MPTHNDNDHLIVTPEDARAEGERPRESASIQWPDHVRYAIMNRVLPKIQGRGRSDSDIVTDVLGSLTVADLEAVLGPHNMQDGWRQPCYYCGKECNGLAGNAALWPVALCHPNEPGKNKWHHAGCVMERLVTHKPGPVPARAYHETERAYLLGLVDRSSGRVVQVGVYSDSERSITQMGSGPAYVRIDVGYGDTFAEARADIMNRLKDDKWINAWVKPLLRADLREEFGIELPKREDGV